MLLVLDITDTTNIVKVGEILLPDFVREIEITYPYLFIANGEAGLRIVDVSNPSVPFEIGFLNDNSLITDIEVYGDYVILGDLYKGISIIDVSVPSIPTEIGNFSEVGVLSGLDVSEDTVYIVDSGYGLLRVIDISEPSSPEEKESCSCVSWNGPLAITGNHAYLTAFLGISIIDITNRYSPTEVGYIHVYGRIIDIAVSEENLFVATDEDLLWIFDIREPTSPIEISHYYSPSNYFRCNKVTIHENYGLVAGYDMIGILDFQDLTSVNELGRYLVPIGVYQVTISGDIAFIWDPSHGLHGIDIRNPEETFESCSFNMQRGAAKMAVQGDLAFIVYRDFELMYILDISVPTNPIVKSSYHLPGYLLEVKVLRNIAYVMSNTEIHIVDFQDASNPVKVGSYIPTSSANLTAMAISEDYAYVLADEIFVVNISDPTQPVEINQFDALPNYGHCIAASGNYLYIADYGEGGFHILDTSDPGDIWESDYLEIPGLECTNIAVENNFVYITAYPHELVVININTSNDPHVIRREKTTGDLHDIFINGSYAYTANGNAGMDIFDLSGCKNRSHSRPFNFED